MVQIAAAKSNLKRVTLELGGKGPLIILPDADCKYKNFISNILVSYILKFLQLFHVVDVAADIAHMGLFFNQGEVCCASSRTFVDASIHDKFVEKAKERAEKHPVGDPFDKTKQMGPLVSKYISIKAQPKVKYQQI